MYLRLRNRAGEVLLWLAKIEKESDPWALQRAITTGRELPNWCKAMIQDCDVLTDHDKPEYYRYDFLKKSLEAIVATDSFDEAQKVIQKKPTLFEAVQWLASNPDDRITRVQVSDDTDYAGALQRGYIHEFQEIFLLVKMHLEEAEQRGLL